jgi:hypothetical protein
MKNITVLLFVVFIFSISCKSKVIKSENKLAEKEINYIPYYLKVNQADSLRLIGNLTRANEIVDSLFQKYEPLNLSFYNEYYAYLGNKVLLKNFDKIDLVLKNSIEKYGLKVENCLQDSIFKIALEKTIFKEKDLNKFYDNYVNNLDLEYRFAIEKMIENDQMVRLTKPINHNNWIKVDKENAENIKSLIEKYGYPSLNKIGRKDFNDKSSHIDLLFLHAKKEELENYILDLMLEAVKKGECEPGDYAVVYDKYLYSTGKYDGKVLYGELRHPNKPLEDVLINPSKIDSIRKSIGLESLNYKYWKYKKLTGNNLNEL